MDEKRFYNILALIVLTVLGVFYWCLFDFLRYDMFDSPSFVGAARQIFGLEGGYNFQSRLSKPIVLIFPGAFEYLTSINAQWGFIIQTIVAYFGCGFLVKRIIFKITQRHDLAFYAMLIFVFSQVFAIFSLMILVDAPGWFYSLMIIDITITKVRNGKMSIWTWSLLSSLSAVGLLVKESVIFSFLFLLFYQFYANEKLKTKLLGTITSVSAFVFVFGITQFFTNILFHDSIIIRLTSQQEQVGFIYYNAENLMQLFRVFDFYWLLVFIGVFVFVTHRTKHPAKNEIYAFTWAMLFSVLLIPIYPFIVDRILFMIAPTLVVFATYSEHVFKKLFLPVILTGGILNIGITWLIYKYNFSDLLFWGIVGYAFFIALLITLKKSQCLKNI